MQYYRLKDIILVFSIITNIAGKFYPVLEWTEEKDLTKNLQVSASLYDTFNTDISGVSEYFVGCWFWLERMPESLEKFTIFETFSKNGEQEDSMKLTLEGETSILKLGYQQSSFGETDYQIIQARRWVHISVIIGLSSYRIKTYFPEIGSGEAIGYFSSQPTPLIRNSTFYFGIDRDRSFKVLGKIRGAIVGDSLPFESEWWNIYFGDPKLVLDSQNGKLNNVSGINFELMGISREYLEHYKIDKDHIIEFGIGLNAQEDFYKSLSTSFIFQITADLNSKIKLISFNYDENLYLDVAIDLSSRRLTFSIIETVMSSIDISEFYIQGLNKLSLIVSQSMNETGQTTIATHILLNHYNTTFTLKNQPYFDITDIIIGDTQGDFLMDIYNIQVFWGNNLAISQESYGLDCLSSLQSFTHGRIYAPSQNFYCINCQSSKKLFNNTCVEQCLQSFSAVSNIGVCVPCSLGCKTCQSSDPNHCLECLSDYILYPNQTCIKKNATIGPAPKIVKVRFDEVMLRIFVLFDMPVYIHRFHDRPNRESPDICSDIFTQDFLSLLGEGNYCFFSGRNHDLLVIWLGIGPTVDLSTRIEFKGNSIFSLYSEISMPTIGKSIELSPNYFQLPHMPSKITININREELFPEFIYDPFDILGDIEVQTCSHIETNKTRDFYFEYFVLKANYGTVDACISLLSSTIYGLPFTWVEKISSSMLGQATFYQSSPSIILARDRETLIKAYEYRYSDVLSTISNHYIVSMKSTSDIHSLDYNLKLQTHESLFAINELHDWHFQKNAKVMVSARHFIQSLDDYNSNLTIIKIDSPLEVNISNATEKHSYFKELKLSASINQGNEISEWKWYCKWNESDCYNSKGNKLIDNHTFREFIVVPSYTMIPGYTYNFIATASVGEQSGMASLQISIVDFDISLPPIIRSMIPFNATHYVNEGGKYYFSTTTQSAEQFDWECNISPMITINYPNYQLIKLLIPPNSHDSLYNLRLISRQSSSSTKFTFQVNTPPINGVFEIKPHSGIDLDTSFELLTNGWTDTDIPLTYRYSTSKLFYQNELQIFFNDYDRAQRKITLLPYDNILAGCKVKLTVSDYYKSSTEVDYFIPLQSEFRTSTYQFLKKLLKARENIDIFTFIQLITIGSYQLDTLYSVRENPMTCSGHGYMKELKACECFDGWASRICSIETKLYTDEKLVRNGITGFLISTITDEYVLGNRLVLNNYLKSLIFMTKFVELLQSDLRNRTTNSIQNLIAIANSTSLVRKFDYLRDIILISGNLLDQIELQCNESPGISVEIFQYNLYNILNSSRLMTRDHFIGKDEIVLKVPNLKMYTEKINLLTLSNKTIQIDEKAPLIKLGNAASHLNQAFDQLSVYNLQIIWWKAGLIDCIGKTQNSINNDIFISITNDKNESMPKLVPFDILYPKSSFKKEEVKCEAKLKCFIDTEIKYEDNQYYRCSCKDIREFSTEELLKQIIEYANFDKVGNVESLLEYSFYRSASFYIAFGLNVFLMAAMIWGYAKDKAQKRLKLLGKMIQPVSIESKLRVTKSSKLIWLKIIWEAIKTTHVLLSSFLLYDPQISRPKRFSIYLCRTMMLMAISALFYQGVTSANYSYLQNALISIAQVIIVSTYSLLVGKLLKNEKGKHHRLSGLTAEEIRKKVRKLISPAETIRRFWKGCIKRMAVFFLIVPLLVSYYLILVISASIDEDSSNRWAIAFLISWVLDLFTFQIFKAVLNALILSFAISRENKTKRKANWAYFIFAPQIIRKMRATVKPFMRRITL